jgi:antitoxin VapB
VRLAGEVAALAGESKTQSARQALRERKKRLLLARSGRFRGNRLVDLLEQKWRPLLPAGVRGSVLSKEQEETILGFGPDDV